VPNRPRALSTAPYLSKIDKSVMQYSAVHISQLDQPSTIRATRLFSLTLFLKLSIVGFRFVGLSSGLHAGASFVFSSGQIIMISSEGQGKDK